MISITSEVKLTHNFIMLHYHTRSNITLSVSPSTMVNFVLLPLVIVCIIIACIICLKMFLIARREHISSHFHNVRDKLDILEKNKFVTLTDMRNNNNVFTVDVNATSAVLKYYMTKTRYISIKIEYIDISIHSDLQLISDHCNHHGTLPPKCLEDTICKIRLMLIDVLHFIFDISNKFPNEVSQYATWYRHIGCHKRSSKNVYQRWVTLTACDTLTRDIHGSDDKKYTLFEFGDI